ncbi:MAG: metallophosphoesterase [Bacteroidetes bacterium]|nr:metallophosphoesterase [Bacteroidota bacterium]
MRVFFPVIFSMISILLLSVIEILLLKTLHRDWWQIPWVRKTSWGVPVAGLFGLSLWALGIVLEFDPMLAIGATLSAIVFVLGIALMLSLPFSAVFHIIDRIVKWIGQKRNERRDMDAQPDPGRRRLLTTSAMIFPAVAVVTGGRGVLNAYGDPRMPDISLSWPDLPHALEGLRVLHISDVHIGFFIGFDELERMIELSAEKQPDLVLITGDFSDDAPTYLDALRLAGQIPSRYGHFASIGNHEYFRGIQSIIRSYERGPIPLLLDSGATVNIDGAALHIAGADDPRSMRNMPEHFFERSIDQAMRDAPSDAFPILLSHRPSGFDYAARRGIPLTLAGHTHGGQIGFNGRSLLYTLNPERYMWGLYEKGDAKLFVSAGAGHWFPYRIGCPAEIPTYILRNSPTGT